MSGMSWAHVDSTEARELRELEDLHDEHEQEAPAQQTLPRVHDSRCRSGWLGEDVDGRPVPCLTCRPHLAAVPCRSCQTLPLVCSAHATATESRCCDRCDHRSPATAGPRPTERS